MEKQTKIMEEIFEEKQLNIIIQGIILMAKVIQSVLIVLAIY